MTELSTSFSLLLSRIFKDLPREFSANPRTSAHSVTQIGFLGTRTIFGTARLHGGGPRGLLNFRLERRIV
jgi:hypothetical protein